MKGIGEVLIAGFGISLLCIKYFYPDVRVRSGGIAGLIMIGTAWYFHFSGVSLLPVLDNLLLFLSTLLIIMMLISENTFRDKGPEVEALTIVLTISLVMATPIFIFIGCKL